MSKGVTFQIVKFLNRCATCGGPATRWVGHSHQVCDPCLALVDEAILKISAVWKARHD